MQKKEREKRKTYHNLNMKIDGKTIKITSGFANNIKGTLDATKSGCVKYIFF